MVGHAQESLESPLKVLFTNLVGCIPLDLTNGTKKMKDPPQKSIEACGKRLNDLVNLSQAKGIVMVGRLAGKWAPKIVKRDFDHSCEILHPAAILRADISQQGLAIQKVIATLEDLFWQVSESYKKD
jgi:uracil-DNA glycosylase